MWSCWHVLCTGYMANYKSYLSHPRDIGDFKVDNTWLTASDMSYAR